MTDLTWGESLFDIYDKLRTYANIAVSTFHIVHSSYLS